MPTTVADNPMTRILSPIRQRRRRSFDLGPSDPDAAALFDELTRQRQEGQARIARSLHRSGALRPDLRTRDAADIIHALVSPEMFGLLVVDRGWPVGRYESWLTGTLIDQLLGS